MGELIDIAVPNAPVVTKWLTGLGTAAPARAALATTAAVKLIANDMKELLGNSSGSGIQWPSLPNPSSAAGEVPAKQSGDYGDSWGSVPATIIGGEISAEAGTDAAQARRLEYGFVGTDSLKRYYNQAPRPHVDQVVDRVVPLWVTRILAMQE